MIVLACDHAGLKLKTQLKKWFEKQKIEVFDCGAMQFDGMDSYVDYAKKALLFFEQLQDKSNAKILLVCGSGVGMSIVANRNKNIRAVLAQTPRQAKQARMHNDCNCLCLGARNVSFFRAKKIAKQFLQSEFLGGKYLQRLNCI